MKRNALFSLVPAVGLAVMLMSAVSAAASVEYASIPPAAFTAFNPEAKLWNWGYKLANDLETGREMFVAPVQLPHGATMTKITWRYWQTDLENFGSIYLERTARDQDYEDLLDPKLNTTGIGVGSVYTTTILSPTIDNQSYDYYIQIMVPNGDFEALGVVIEYVPAGMSTSLPLVLRSFFP